MKVLIRVDGAGGYVERQIPDGTLKVSGQGNFVYVESENRMVAVFGRDQILGVIDE